MVYVCGTLWYETKIYGIVLTFYDSMWLSDPSALCNRSSMIPMSMSIEACVWECDTICIHAIRERSGSLLCLFGDGDKKVGCFC